MFAVIRNLHSCCPAVGTSTLSVLPTENRLCGDVCFLVLLDFNFGVILLFMLPLGRRIVLSCSPLRSQAKAFDGDYCAKVCPNTEGLVVKRKDSVMLPLVMLKHVKATLG